MSEQTFKFAEVRVAPPSRSPAEGVSPRDAAIAEYQRVMTDIAVLQMSGRLPRGHIRLREVGSDVFDIIGPPTWM